MGKKGKGVVKSSLEMETVETPVSEPVIASMPIEALPQSVDLALHILVRLRAEGLQLLDLRGKSDVADFFLLGTCSSEAQMQAILNALQRDFKTLHVDHLGVEYRAGVRWAVFDGIDVMVHLFEEKAREEYALDRLWRDAPEIALDLAHYETVITGDVPDEDLV
ncbi:MAG TPA: ribosome silencing factor [Fibrobacteraceae bacterium]|nr:ribosome silencing factor [Fibrobacteraceae bacterium]